jgi:hypothetical protein
LKFCHLNVNPKLHKIALKSVPLIGCFGLLSCVKKNTVSEQKGADYADQLFPKQNSMVPATTFAICIDSTLNLKDFVAKLKLTSFKISLNEADLLAKNRVKCTFAHGQTKGSNSSLPKRSTDRLGIIKVAWKLNLDLWTFVYVDEDYNTYEKQVSEKEGDTIAAILADSNDSCESQKGTCPIDLIPREKLHFDQIKKAVPMHFKDYDALTKELSLRKTDPSPDGLFQDPRVVHIIRNDLIVLFHNLKINDDERINYIAKAFGAAFFPENEAKGIAAGAAALLDFKSAVINGKGLQNTKLVQKLIELEPALDGATLNISEIASKPEFKGLPNAIAKRYPEIANDIKTYYQKVQITTLLGYMRTKIIAENSK